MDHQHGALRGRCRVRGFEIEAVVQFCIGGDNETVVRERAIEHFLYLRGFKHYLFFRIQRFIIEDQCRPNRGRFAIFYTCRAGGLPGCAGGSIVPGCLSLVKGFLQAINAVRGIIVACLSRNSIKCFRPTLFPISRNNQPTALCIRSSLSHSNRSAT